MQNLRERIKETPGGMLCPLTNDACVYVNFADGFSDCAHYNPNTDECVHVEAAQAQVKMANLLEQFADCTTARGFRPERMLGVITE